MFFRDNGSVGFTVPATRYTRAVRVAVSRKAFSVLVADNLIPGPDPLGYVMFATFAPGAYVNGAWGSWSVWHVDPPYHTGVRFFGGSRRAVRDALAKLEGRTDA